MSTHELNVLITPRSLSKGGHPALKALEDAGFTLKMPWPGLQPNEAQLLEVLPSCVGYLAGVEPITKKILEASKNLRIISRNGVGLDNVDLKVAERLGIAVTGTPGANSQGVAELALTLMLQGIRLVSWHDRTLRSGQWSRQIGTEVKGKTLGIIGCGNIGLRLAKIALGIGMRVIGYDLYQDPQVQGLQGFSYVDLNQIFSDSDVISLHCPPGEKPLLDAKSLETLRGNVVVVNTARDALVDHQAMLEALEENRVRAYATDVFEKEPPQLDSLLQHERVIMTPHLGGYTKESVERATVAAVEQIINHLT